MTHGLNLAGNFHYCLAIDVTNQVEIREAKAFAERLAERAIRMGGTCSGEHGLGYGKLKFMEVSRPPVYASSFEWLCGVFVRRARGDRTWADQPEPQMEHGEAAVGVMRAIKVGEDDGSRVLFC